MDPAIQALMIRPADWAALLDGLVRGIGYDLAAIASIVLVAAVLAACFGRRDTPAAASRTDRECPAWQPLAPTAIQQGTFPSVVVVTRGRYAMHPGHARHRYTRRRATRRAAVASSLGMLPY